MVEKVSELGKRRVEGRCTSHGRGHLADGKDDDETPGPLQKIRASICEIAELYAQKYLEEFPQLGSFVNGIWNMLTTVGPGTREDVVRIRHRNGFDHV